MTFNKVITDPTFGFLICKRINNINKNINKKNINKIKNYQDKICIISLCQAHSHIDTQ